MGVLGEGAFGKVVKAEYYKTVTDRGQEIGRVVAVKMLRGKLFFSYKSCFKLIYVVVFSGEHIAWFTLETHSIIFQRWACIFPIFHAVFY